MKSFSKLLNTVQELPEKGRRLIVGILMIVSAILLFVSWGSVTSTRLTNLSENTLLENTDFLAKSPLLEELSKPNETSSSFASPVVSPLKGLWESVMLLGKKVGKTSYKLLENASGTFASLPHSFMNQLGMAADFVADKLR